MQPRLMRSRRDKVIAGVCGGLAQYFEVDATLIRLVFAVLGLAGPGFPLYFILWFVMQRTLQQALFFSLPLLL